MPPKLPDALGSTSDILIRRQAARLFFFVFTVATAVSGLDLEVDAVGTVLVT